MNDKLVLRIQASFKNLKLHKLVGNTYNCIFITNTMAITSYKKPTIS